MLIHRTHGQIDLLRWFCQRKISGPVHCLDNELVKIKNLPQTPNSLSVKSHVLGKGLSTTELMTILQEDPNSLIVPVAVATSKSLVCHIEKGKMLLFLDQHHDISVKHLGSAKRSPRKVSYNLFLVRQTFLNVCRTMFRYHLTVCRLK